MLARSRIFTFFFACIRTVASLVTVVPPRLFQSVTCIAGRIYALIASIRIVAHLASFAIVRVQFALVYVFASVSIQPVT